jgi:hypothetical protein
MKQKYSTREDWFMAAVEELRKHFSANGYKIPKTVKVSCGWTAGDRKKVIGECWIPDASKGGFTEIFISPIHDSKEVAGPNGALETLVHELIHATIFPERGHKAPFKQAMKAVGLEGVAKSTSATEELCELFKTIVNKLGQYPHRALELGMRDVRKQSTRLIKVGCKKCDYIARVTRKHLDMSGTPLCPTHKIPFVEM